MSEDAKKSKRNIKPFDGEKYSIWKYRIRALIAEEDALKVLDNVAPLSPDDNWKRSERIAKGIIIEYLTDSMLSFSTEEDTAKDVIKKLDAIYDRKSLATQLSIEKRLLSLKFKETTPLSRHLICFDEMIVELQAAGASLNEMSRVARLLLTLPNSYDPIVTAIQTQADENLTLAFVKVKLLDYEVKLQNEKCETSAKVLQTEAVTENRKFRKNNGFKGTFKRRQNFSNKNKKFNKNYNNKRCDHCGRRNHEKKNCYYYNRNIVAENNQRTLQTVQMQNEGQSFAFMTGDLMSEEGESNEIKNIKFLIDSGATDHVVKDIDIFKTLLDLQKPIKISMAKKGEVIDATKIGSIEITTNLGVTGVLENVLYAPAAIANLLSVRRIQEAGMKVIFGEYGGVMVKQGGKAILTDEQLADSLTKSLPVAKFSYIRNQMGVKEYK